MIQGATIPRASAKRLAAETMTIAVSHAHTGIARAKARTPMPECVTLASVKSARR